MGSLRWTEDGGMVECNAVLYDPGDWTDRREFHQQRTYPPPREAAAWMAARWQRDISGLEGAE